jgi:hypothetical protein
MAVFATCPQQTSVCLTAAVMPRKNRSLRSITLSPKRSSSPGPPSPTFSETTHASAIDFGVNGPEKIITRANLKLSLQSYDEFMSCSANYRAALLHMSKATAAFADSLEKCSGLKGPSYEAGTRLQAASGLHHLIGNHWHVLVRRVLCSLVSTPPTLSSGGIARQKFRETFASTLGHLQNNS